MSENIEKQEKLTLLLTGTIDTFVYERIRSFIAIKDTNERLLQYQKAIEFYIQNSPFTDIVFIENSGFDFNYKKYETLAEKHNKEFEFISGEVFSDKVNAYGRSWGEAYLIQEAVEKSKLIRQSSNFYKITGRIILRNVVPVVNMTRTHSNTFIINPCRRVCYTHFFKVSVLDFNKYFNNLYKNCNDIKHNTIEKIYYENLRRYRKEIDCRGLSIRPIFDGKIGLNNSLYTRRNNIVNIIESVLYKIGFFKLL